MGIDTFELVMEVEEAFGIKIPSDAAEQIATVGGLFEFIKSETELAPAGTCLTAATFYKIRSGLLTEGIGERFGPSTRLDAILPNQNRRSFWGALERNTNLRLPTLVRPNWVVLVNIVMTMVVSFAIAFLVSERNLTGYLFPIFGMACLFFFGILTTSATTPLATNFANEFAAFRGLSERALALNATKLKNEFGPMGPNDIWVVLRDLITNQLGVDSDEVTPDAHFVKDLGCD